MGIEIVRHEISKDATGKIVKGIIGVNYTNPTTGRTSYRDRVFTIGAGGDFQTVPSKVEFAAKIKEWLTTTLVQGKTILQGMKDQTNVQYEAFTALKETDTGSLLKTAIPEI